MRKTYAYNAIAIGAVVGLLIWAYMENVALAIVAAVGISIVGFVAIRFIEKAIEAGVDAAADAAAKAYRKHKEKKESEK